jgi:hypothetical protein
MTAIRERPPPENESPGTAPAAPGQSIPTQRQDKARKAILQGSSLERAWHELNSRNDRAPASTVEALMFELRRGGAALTDPNNQRRLSELSEMQLHEACARLQNFKPKIARPWTADEIEALVAAWCDLHHG